MQQQQGNVDDPNRALVPAGGQKKRKGAEVVVTSGDGRPVTGGSLAMGAPGVHSEPLKQVTPDDSFFDHAVTSSDWQFAAVAALEPKPKSAIWDQQDALDASISNIVGQISRAAIDRPNLLPDLAEGLADALHRVGTQVFNQHLGDMMTNFLGAQLTDFINTLGTPEVRARWEAAEKRFGWNAWTREQWSNMPRDVTVYIMDTGIFFLVLLRKALDDLTAQENHVSPTEPLTQPEIAVLRDYVLPEVRRIKLLSERLRELYDAFEANYRRLLAQAQMLWWITFCFSVRVGLHQYEGLVERLAQIVADRHVLARAASLEVPTRILLSALDPANPATRRILMTLAESKDYFGSFTDPEQRLNTLLDYLRICARPLRELQNPVELAQAVADRRVAINFIANIKHKFSTGTVVFPNPVAARQAIAEPPVPMEGAGTVAIVQRQINAEAGAATTTTKSSVPIRHLPVDDFIHVRIDWNDDGPPPEEPAKSVVAPPLPTGSYPPLGTPAVKPAAASVDVSPAPIGVFPAPSGISVAPVGGAVVRRVASKGGKPSGNF